MNPDGSVAFSVPQQISFIVSVVLPLLIAVVIRPAWPRDLKAIVSFGICALVALGAVWLDGRFNPQNIGATVLPVFGLAAMFYQAFWKPTEIAPAIEHNINSGRGTP